jgi:hypothetical protein
LTDRSEATMRVTLDDGRALFFKLAHLQVGVSQALVSQHLEPILRLRNLQLQRQRYCTYVG